MVKLFAVMVVGDREVGKTCMARTVESGDFPLGCDYISQGGFYASRFTFNDTVPCKVQLWDDVCNPGSSRIHIIRPTYYSKKQVFIAMYSVDSRESFNNVRNRWIPELRGYHPKVPILVVASKTDLRDNGEYETISTAEGYSLAREMKTGYWEVSSLLKKGLDELLEYLVELRLLNTDEMIQELDISSAFIPPLKPPPEPKPFIKAAPSTFVDDWLQTLEDPEKYHDVRFMVEGQTPILSHRIILCSASSFFRKLFRTRATAVSSHALDMDEFNMQEIKGIQRVHDSPDGRMVILEMYADIKASTMVKVLECVYTGRLSGFFTSAGVLELKHVADIFGLKQLMSYLLEISVDSPGLHKIDFTDDKKMASMGEFVNQDTLSDLVFNVKGCQIPAHKVVVCARSPWISALVESGCQEEGSHMEIPVSDVSVKIFLAYLEYLYTDDVRWNDSSDVIGLLAFADKIGAHRLVSLCEVHLKPEVEAALEKFGEGEYIGAIELMKRFKSYNVNKMADWCRNHICYHYTEFSDKEEFSTLDKEDQDFIKRHCWPPVTYVYELEDYQRALSRTSYHSNLEKLAAEVEEAPRKEKGIKNGCSVS